MSTSIYHLTVLLLLAQSSCCLVGRRRDTTPVRNAQCPLDYYWFDGQGLTKAKTQKPTRADLSDVRLYRNYMAVSEVLPLGHHFRVTAKFKAADLRVDLGREGRLIIAKEGGHHVESDLLPPSIYPIPVSVRPLAQQLEADLRARCDGPLDLKLEYTGWNRSLYVREFIAHYPSRRATELVGWFADATLVMDESLTHIVGVMQDLSGFGSITIGGSSQWVELPQQTGVPKLWVSWNEMRGLSPQLADAARRYGVKAPPPPLTTLVPTDAPMLPPGYVSRVRAVVSLAGQELDVPLDLHDAVFGVNASGVGAVTLGGIPYRLQVTLSPSMPRTPQPGRMRDRYTGTLKLQLDDDRGRTGWHRSYPVVGELDLEGASVVAPAGFDMQQDAITNGPLPFHEPGRRGSFSLNRSLFDDPRPSPKAPTPFLKR